MTSKKEMTLEELAEKLSTKQSWIRKELEKTMEQFRADTAGIADSGLYVVVANDNGCCSFDIAIVPGSKWLHTILDPYDFREYSENNEYQYEDMDIIRQVCKKLPEALKTLKAKMIESMDNLDTLGNSLK